MSEDRIIADHRIMGGVPCIRGTRIPVATIVGLIAEGYTVDAVTADYPQRLSRTLGPLSASPPLPWRSVSSAADSCVRFLIDECISARIVPLLAEGKHDVVHVKERELQGHIDDEVLELAHAEERVLISADTDFGEILARSGAALPSLILFRQGNRSPEHRAASLLANLNEIADDLAAGAVVVLAEDRIRVRRLPLR